MNSQDYWTLKAMSTFGGSFVKALAEAAHHADSANLRKIKDTWPAYWGSYETMGRRMEAEADNGDEKLADLGLLRGQDHG